MREETRSIGPLHRGVRFCAELSAGFHGSAIESLCFVEVTFDESPNGIAPGLQCHHREHPLGAFFGQVEMLLGNVIVSHGPAAPCFGYVLEERTFFKGRIQLKGGAADFCKGPAGQMSLVVVGGFDFLKLFQKSLCGTLPCVGTSHDGLKGFRFFDGPLSYIADIHSERQVCGLLYQIIHWRLEAINASQFGPYPNPQVIYMSPQYLHSIIENFRAFSSSSSFRMCSLRSTPESMN